MSDQNVSCTAAATFEENLVSHSPGCPNTADYRDTQSAEKFCLAHYSAYMQTVSPERAMAWEPIAP